MLVGANPCGLKLSHPVKPTRQQAGDGSPLLRLLLKSFRLLLKKIISNGAKSQGAEHLFYRLTIFDAAVYSRYDKLLNLSCEKK